MRFDLLTIELFIAICEAASIAKAAEQKNIAASARPSAKRPFPAVLIALTNSQKLPSLQAGK